MTQCAKLLGLFQDRGIRRDRVLRRMADVRADFEDQRGNMIEEALGRKDLARVHRQQAEKTLEPAGRKRFVLELHPIRDDVAKISGEHETTEYRHRQGFWKSSAGGIDEDTKKSFFFVPSCLRG